jgi:hypothetical protein
LLEALRESNVATYSISTGDFSSAILRKVSEASGGFMISATNFERDAERLIEELDHYYLLGFYPNDPDPNDKSYRPLEVRVTRPGMTVRHRQGYQISRRATAPKNKDPLGRLVGGVLPQVDLPLRLSATPMRAASTSATRVCIALEVRAERALLAEADGSLRDLLKYAVWAVDLKKKKAVARVAREARLVVSSSEAALRVPNTVTYQVQTSLTLPPGRYQLRASAISTKVSRGGSVYLDTWIPDAREQEIELGGILLGYANGARVPVVPGGLTEGILRFSPTLDRIFSPGDDLRLYCDVLGRRKASADVAIDLVDAAGQVMWTRSRSESQSTAVDLTVSLDTLAPGDYRFHVSAAAGATVAQREVGFAVR